MASRDVERFVVDRVATHRWRACDCWCGREFRREPLWRVRYWRSGWLRSTWYSCDACAGAVTDKAADGSPIGMLEWHRALMLRLRDAPEHR